MTLDFDGTPPTAVALPTCRVGDTLSDRYRLDAEIGRGGMGIVFRAWDSELERPVAVKVMAANLEADDAHAHLFREARAAAALSHPHVVAVFEVGAHENMPYFVMELVDGTSLADRPPDDLSDIIEIAQQICDALSHAHGNGLVHRDLKPGNVLLEERSGKDSVKIVDLGLAVRDRGVRITRQGGISGTVAYMAPEQALGREVDGRADLYALGVMLYQFTTGRLPFDGDNALAVLSQHLHAPVVPPRTYRDDLPKNLETAILRLLAKDPDDRYATAAETAAAIFAYVDSLRLYERARECAEALGRSDELPAIDTAMGDVYTLKGEPLTAAEHFERALVATNDPTQALRLKCKIGEAFVLIGDTRALAFVEEAKAVIDPATQPAEFARVTMIEGRFHHYHGRSREAAERLHQSLKAAEQSDDVVLQGWILGYLAGAYQHLIEFEESNRGAQRAIDLGNEKDNPGVASIGHEFLMENAFMRGRWQESLEHVERHRMLAEKACSSDRRAWNFLGLAYARIGQGELDKAKTALADGIHLADRLGDERLAVFLGCWRAQVLADCGLIDEAVDVADHWLERADSLGFKSGQGEALRVRAYVASRTGDHDRVLEDAATAESLFEGSDECVHPIWFSNIICEALISTGRHDEAYDKVRSTLEATGTAGMPHWEALALRERGRLAMARGQRDKARPDIEAAVQILDKLGSRIELGRTLVLRASLSESEDAELDRQKARELFEACGAAGDLAALARS